MNTLINNQCSEKTRDSKIKVEEKGKKAVILNKNNEEFFKINIDGCLIKNKTAADKAIKKVSTNKQEGCKLLIIELKGTDIDKAVDQIDATINFIKSEDTDCKKIAALIVCNSSPHFANKARKGIERIRKDHRIILRTTTKNQEHDFDSFFS